MTVQNTSSIPPSIQKQLPQAVLRKVQEMDEVAQMDFVAEFQKRKKSLGLAFVLLGGGLHRAYLGQVWLTLLFFGTFGGFIIWWFIDLLRLSHIVGEHNRSIAIDVLRDSQILR